MAWDYDLWAVAEVRFWHNRDLPLDARNVRFRGMAEATSVTVTGAKRPRLGLAECRMAAFETWIVENCHWPELDAAKRCRPVPIVQVQPECASNDHRVPVAL
jgi:hypothetical protein